MTMSEPGRRGGDSPSIFVQYFTFSIPSNCGTRGLDPVAVRKLFPVMRVLSSAVVLFSLFVVTFT